MLSKIFLALFLLITTASLVLLIYAAFVYQPVIVPSLVIPDGDPTTIINFVYA